MKTTRKITSIVLALSAGVMISRADVLNWDPLLNGVSTGGSGGTGTWNLTTANWWSGAADVQWKDNSIFGTNTAVFGGTAGTVTLGASLSASNLQFAITGYTLSGANTLTLGSGGIDASILSSGVTTIGLPMTLVGQQPWLVSPGATLNIKGTVSRAIGASVDFPAAGVTNSAWVNDATGILGAWATVGGYNSSVGDWAANDGTGNIITYTNYTIVSSTSNTSPDLTASATQNWASGDPTGSGNFISTITNSATINSLVQMGDVRVNPGVTLTLNSGGLILHGPSRWMLAGTNSWLKTGTASGELFVHSPNTGGGNWTIWPIIEDNGTTPLILIKDGAGMAKLGNLSTYTGGSIVNNGILACTSGAEFGNGNGPTGLITPFGSGPITVNNGAELQLGSNPGNAFGEYDYTNNITVNSGSILAWDAFHHLKGTVNVAGPTTIGSTFDSPNDALNNGYAKGVWIDGNITGTGDLTIQHSGLNTGNPWNSSTIYLANTDSAAQNTYSGNVTINPFDNQAGSYLYLISAYPMANATITLAGDNPQTTGRMGVPTLVFGSGTNGDGIGFATIGGLAGPGSLILQNTRISKSSTATLSYSYGAGITLTVGNNNSSTIYGGAISGSGGLVKVGNGTLTLSGQNTYTGDTVLNGGSILINGSWLASSNVIVAVGRTLDSSALVPANMVANQVLWGSGTYNGSFSAPSGAGVSAGTDGTYGTNTITGSLTLGAGAVAYFDVGTSIAGPNDRVVLGGTLTANNNVVHLKAPSTSVNLDSTGDYLLFSVPAGVTGTFATTPTWDVAPLNQAHYSIQTSNAAVYLHYSAVAGPTGVGSSSPSPVRRNQTVVLTVTAANGTAGTVNSVVVDASSIGGSATLALVNSGGNVWTNAVALAPSLDAGSRTLVATVTDTASLTAFVNIPVNVVVGNDVWNGAGADNNLSTALNWTNQAAPAYVGDSLQFGGSTRLTPNVDNSYIVTGVLFDPTAGAFNIGSLANTLELTNGSVANNSPNTQTISAPLALSGTATFNTASNDVVVSGVASDGGAQGGITKTGSHTLTISGAQQYTGPTTVNGGVLNYTGSTFVSTNSPSTLFIGSAAGRAVLNVSSTSVLSPYYLLIGNATNSVGAIYQSGGTMNATNNSGFDNLSVGNVAGSYGYYGVNGGTFSVNGICVGGEANSGAGASFGTPGGNGIFEVNGGTVTNVGWMVIARQNSGTVGPSTGIVNVYNGLMTFAGGGIVGPWDTGESAIINVMGGTVVSSNQAVRLGNTGFPGILNLDGGQLTASELTGYNGPNYSVVSFGQVNFNGGTLQAPIANADFIRVTTATIYSGGATIDNNGNAVTVNQALLAPTGSGVHVTSFTGGAGYIAPPIVTVVNGTNDTTGTGATAIAQINPATGTVTNVIVTCPGMNYTGTPNFVFSGGGATTPAAVTGASLVPNTGGGLTSMGAGTLTLASSNSTYSGNTVVASGTLELVNPILAQASTVTVSNGAVLQLDFSTTNQIAGLKLNGVSEPFGVYNSTTSPGLISGTGSLLVASPIASNPTNIVFSVSGSGTSKTLSLSWPSDHLGWILQQDTNGLSNSSTNWFDVPGTATITTTNIPVNPAVTNTYYRLRHP